MRNTSRCRPSKRRARGSAMIEFVVVGPIITLLGLGILQYCLMFFAKSQFDHAAFMAARAGSVAHAAIAAIRLAYQKALVPLYGGGQNSAELDQAYARVRADVTPQTVCIQVLNPSRESYEDFATDAVLNAHYRVRAIPNTGLALRSDLDVVGARSRQTLQDANLLKLRIIHGYLPKVWLIGSLYNSFLRRQDDGVDAFKTQLIAQGRIPVVSHITLEMQSDALEQESDLVHFDLPRSNALPSCNFQPEIHGL